MNKFYKIILLLGFLIFTVISSFSNEKIVINDSLNREIEIPYDPGKIICSGPGCLRLVTYLNAQNRVVAVDSVEKKSFKYNARPYFIANPQFTKLPLFGEMRGFDNPELIILLDPRPDIIFKTYPFMGYDIYELEKKTDIPVVGLDYGDMLLNKEKFYKSLKLIADVLEKEERAEEIINYFNSMIDDLNKRTSKIEKKDSKTCYIGGIAYKGPHGLLSTEVNYPCFKFVNVDNIASDNNKNIMQSHTVISKEKLLEWDPDIIFVDLSSMQLKKKQNPLYELKNDKTYKNLKAVKNNQVYTVIPYNWYTINYGSVFANSYYIGKVLYPELFKDIDPAKKADEIYKFLLGKPVYKKLDKMFNNEVFNRINL